MKEELEELRDHIKYMAEGQKVSKAGRKPTDKSRDELYRSNGCANKVQRMKITITAALNLYHEKRDLKYRHNIKEDIKYYYNVAYNDLIDIFFNRE